MTVEEYQDHTSNNDGYCTLCESVTLFGGVEPDARKYECPACGEMTVFGVEEALMMGLVTLE